MNGIVNLVATGISSGAVMSASQGILVQGIRMSGSNDRGVQGFASKAQAVQQIVSEQDKPSGWHLAPAYMTDASSADEAGTRLPAHLLAARLRTTDPATVIRSRRRSRLR